MRRVNRIIGVLGVVLLLCTAGAGPVQSESDGARSESDGTPPAVEESPSVQDWDSRCADIAGSDLCLMWERNANYEGYLEVWYSKRSGPRRYIRLYVAGCGLSPYQVYEGYISPGQTRAGAWDGYLYPGSCWVGICGSAMPDGPPGSCTPSPAPTHTART
jgi:hypothetical protein